MYDLCDEMFPICRSITGEGVRKTLNILKSVYLNMKVYEVPSVTQVFAWIVPKEWNIRDATIENSKGEKIIDFKKNNLHVMGYSLPSDKIVSLEELKKIIYIQPDQADVVPDVISYYKERYGFCMAKNQKNIRGKCLSYFY
jgi:aminopeptidase-like protein